MKRILPLLLCLLLLGCGREADEPETETTIPTTAPVILSETPKGLYDPESALEQATAGALRVYPLRFSTITAMRSWGDGLLIFSVGDEATAITLLAGDELHVTASTVLNWELDPCGPSLQIWDQVLSCFDPVRRETLVLDGNLKEVGHYPAPEDLEGTPLLSESRNQLYYCTADALCCWDLETDIRRTIQERPQGGLTLTGLHVSDTILSCREGDKTLLFSAQDGRLLYEIPGAPVLYTDADRFFGAVPAGNTKTLIFGRGEGEKYILSPAEFPEDVFYLRPRNGVVTSRAAEGRLQMDYYDLETGLRVSRLELSGENLPIAVEADGSGNVYILRMDEDYGCEVIYRWETTAESLATGDETVYTGPYYSASNPDLGGLEACRVRAQELGSKYGVNILLWKDALAAKPQDVKLEEEYLVPVLRRELDILDEELSRYPATVLEQTVSHFSGLTICLVRSVTEGGKSLPGLQSMEEMQAYVFLPAGPDLPEALHRELYHVMETRILSKSTALYRWDEENPQPFQYGEAVPEAYLTGETQAFLDEESTTSSREDQARVFARAMLPGGAELFKAPGLQGKLTLLCQGIRGAYGLKKSPEVFPWEQHLKEPLAP